MNPWNPLYEPAPRWVALPGDPPALRRWLRARASEEAPDADESLRIAEESQ